MKTYQILVLNGPNMGALGVRQPDIYGTQGLDDLPAVLASVLGPDMARVRVEMFQSNHEGDLVDRLEQARREGVAGVVLNAGALTHTSLVLADCLAWLGLPVIEVHCSNVFARTDSELRHTSLIGAHVCGVIAGFGLVSYALGVRALLTCLES